jgi:acyl-CoA thioester hydrolase
MTRGDYSHFLPIATRWKDNDVDGHVNNMDHSLLDA